MTEKKIDKPYFKLFKTGIISVIILMSIIYLSSIFLKFITNHGKELETPNFVGMSIDDAIKLCEAKGLRYEVDSIFVEGKKGNVIKQRPLAYSDSIESHIKVNRKIYLTSIRQGIQMVKFPDLKDNSMNLAKFKLNAVGLIPEWKFVSSPYKNLVINYYYKNKELKKMDLVPKGSKVVIEIGQGLDNNTLQNYIGKSYSEIFELIDTSELNVIFTISGNCPTFMDTLNSKIISQDPLPNDTLFLNSINLLKLHLRCSSTNEPE